MNDTGGEKPRERETEPSRQDAERSDGGWGKNLWSILLSIIGLAGSSGLVGSWIQHEQWSYQNSVAAKNEDSKNLLEIENTLTELTEPRYFIASRIIEKLTSGAQQEDLSSDERDFSQIESKWLDAEPKLRSYLEYYVDVPSHKRTGSKREIIYDSNPECKDYGFPADPQFDSGSASDVLQFYAHCQGWVAKDIKTYFDSRKPLHHAAPAQSPKSAEVDFEIDKIRLDDIWWINDVLRCIVMRRAYDIQNASKDSSWFLGDLLWRSRKSDAADPTARDCVADYLKHAGEKAKQVSAQTKK